MEIKEDCFAYENYSCKVIKEMNCNGCKFYKKAGTECDTCQNKGKETCKKCHE